MRTLVISDLHLGSRLRRDALWSPAVLDRLLATVRRCDRLVLLGDVLELWEGRPRAALDAARPVLRALGAAVEEVVIVAGNHDAATIRPWLRSRGDTLGLEEDVPPDATALLAAMTEAVRAGGASVRAAYPGLWLDEDRTIYAHHGHYADALLVVPREIERILPDVLRRPLRAIPRRDALPADFERATGYGFASVQTALEATLPPGIGDAIDGAAGVTRGLLMAAVPLVEVLPLTRLLAPLSAGLLGHELRRNGLRAMADTAVRLGLGAEHVVFGHVHRTGPLPGDRVDEWRPLEDGPQLWNTGSWVYEPLLVAGARPGHPYWPGAAVMLREGGTPRVVELLRDVPRKDLTVSAA